METDAAVTIIPPVLPVCVQWCIKCRAVGRLDLPSHNTLHGLMPPLAGKWVRGGVEWGVNSGSAQEQSPLFIHRPASLAGRLPVCSSPTRPAGDVLLLSLVRQVHSRKLSDANSAWEQESSQGHGFLSWG